MRVVADTNVVVSGFLWHGNERRLMDAARDGIIELFTSQKLLDDLEDVLARPKFSSRLIRKNVSRQFLVGEYSELATVAQPYKLANGVSRDPDDDKVLACAVVADCEVNCYRRR